MLRNLIRTSRCNRLVLREEPFDKLSWSLSERAEPRSQLLPSLQIYASSSSRQKHLSVKIKAERGEKESEKTRDSLGMGVCLFYVTYVVCVLEGALHRKLT